MAAGDHLGPESANVRPRSCFVIAGIEYTGIRGGARGIEVARCPRREHVARVQGVFLAGKEVVRLVQADEALRVQGSRKQLGRVIDLDDVVEGGMHDEKRLAQRPDGCRKLVALQVVEELLLHRERPSAEVHLRDAFIAQRLLGAGEQVTDVLGIRW